MSEVNPPAISGLLPDHDHHSYTTNEFYEVLRAMGRTKGLSGTVDDFYFTTVEVEDHAHNGNAINRYPVGLSREMGMTPALNRITRFSSAADAVRALEESIAKFLDTPATKWGPQYLRGTVRAHRFRRVLTIDDA